MRQNVRLQQLTQWVRLQPGWEQAQLQVASADASFRRYFRAQSGQHSAIVMDAPPDKENTALFVSMTQRLQHTHAHVPLLLAQNIEQGFLLMEDLGDTPLLNVLSQSTPLQADQFYQQALHTLLALQTADCHHLPVYDQKKLYAEMVLMPEWFLEQHLKIPGTHLPHTLIEQVFSWLVDEIAQQPQVFVHRDYHSRNLMVTPDHSLGVIDYQDAVYGPVTYDLVSLLRDCYIAWPPPLIQQWVSSFYEQAIHQGILQPVDEYTFIRWFDLMGLQRHLKILGIFCRLFHRDGKENYLNDLPLTLTYVIQVGERYPEMAPLITWMREMNIPKRVGTVEIQVCV